MTGRGTEIMYRKGVLDVEKRFPQIDPYKTGQTIKRMMKEKGMTIRDVQEYLGLAVPQSIYHWFSGTNVPTVDHLYALSELFGVPMDMLVCGNKKEIFGFYRQPICERFFMYYEKCLELRAG